MIPKHRVVIQVLTFFNEFGSSKKASEVALLSRLKRKSAIKHRKKKGGKWNQNQVFNGIETIQ